MTPPKEEERVIMDEFNGGKTARKLVEEGFDVSPNTLEEETFSTYTTAKQEPLNIKTLRKAAMSIQKMKEPELPKGLGWFTKIMARFGWHRKYEIIIFDKEQFRRNIFNINPHV